MLKTLLLLTTLAALTFGPAHVAGAENVAASATNSAVETDSTTVDALIAEALGNNLELKFYEAEMMAATAGRKSAAATREVVDRFAEARRWAPDSVKKFREAAELADPHYHLGDVPIATLLPALYERFDGGRGNGAQPATSPSTGGHA